MTRNELRLLFAVVSLLVSTTVMIFTNNRIIMAVVIGLLCLFSFKVYRLYVLKPINHYLYYQRNSKTSVSFHIRLDHTGRRTKPEDIYNECVEAVDKIKSLINAGDPKIKYVKTIHISSLLITPRLAEKYGFKARKSNWLILLFHSFTYFFELPKGFTIRERFRNARRKFKRGLYYIDIDFELKKCSVTSATFWMVFLIGIAIWYFAAGYLNLSLAAGYLTLSGYVVFASLFFHKYVTAPINDYLFYTFKNKKTIEFHVRPKSFESYTKPETYYQEGFKAIQTLLDAQSAPNNQFSAVEKIYMISFLITPKLAEKYGLTVKRSMNYPFRIFLFFVQLIEYKRHDSFMKAFNNACRKFKRGLYYVEINLKETGELIAKPC